MQLQLPGGSRVWGKYLSELVIVAAGVALGLAATQWAEDRQVRSQTNDAYDVLSDELADNLHAVRKRQAVQSCVQQRIAALRKWTEQQSQGGGAALPADIGDPGISLILDSVWDVSKSGQVVAKMPLELRRRYAAVYDLFEHFATVQQLEREVWFAIGDYGGLSKVTPSQQARLSGLLSRAAIYDQALSSTVPGIISDLSRLKVEPTDPPDYASMRQRAICKPFQN